MLVLLILLLSVVQAQESRIEQVLDKAGDLVQELANQAVLNDQNTCELLPNCTLNTCLRRSCYPQSKDEIKSLQCTVVKSSSGCSSSCDSVLVSTNQSYVRVSPFASIDNDYELQKSVCAQKPLNEKLQQGWQVSSQLSQGWFFFGSAHGFLYVYPGRDYLYAEQCYQYDPRIRPWYINSLAVVKSLYVLLDNSPSMSLPVGSLSPQSRLDVGKGIVHELLNTLVNGDQVAVSKLNIDQLVQKPVLVSLKSTEMSLKQPEIIALKEAVESLTVDTSQTDMAKALTGALQFYNSDNSSSNLKVLLILTDGTFAGNLNITAMDPVFQQLNQENVVVFLYRIGYEVSNDLKLQQMKTKLNMTFETVTDSDNPLWRIRSYFDYIAWLRFVNVNKKPIWVPLYFDVAGLGNITTATYPAFDVNQRLIGVAALDLDTTKYVIELGMSAVGDAVSKRSPPPSFQQALELVQTVNNESMTCLKSQLAPLCPRRDFNTPGINFMCCGSTCTLSDSSNGFERGKAGMIAGASIGAFVVAVMSILVSCWCIRRAKQRREESIKAKEKAAAENERWSNWIVPETTPTPSQL